MRHTAVLLLALLCLGLTLPAPLPAQEVFTLDAVRAQVKRQHGAVAQLPADTLARALAGKGDVLLLDVREAEEFAVSRIPGAVRVDPGIWRSTFLRQFAGKARGRTVVFYCAVGERSSKLAERVQVALKDQGARAVYNLDGGIFLWHNEARPLTGANGATDYVHPFDAYWGRLIKRTELVRTSP